MIMKKPIPITSDEVLNELFRLTQRQKSGDPGLTVTEISEKLGKARDSVRDMIRLAMKKGLVVVGKRPEPTISGGMYPVPVYTFKMPK